jgi:integrase
MCTVCCTRRSNVLRLDKLVRNVSDSLRDEDMPRVEQREAQAHEPAAIAKLFPESEQSRHWSLITLVIAGGMRRGELAALRWSDVDLATPNHDPRELAEFPASRGSRTRKATRSDGSSCRSLRCRRNAVSASCRLPRS